LSRKETTPSLDVDLADFSSWSPPQEHDSREKQWENVKAA